VRPWLFTRAMQESMCPPLMRQVAIWLALPLARGRLAWWHAGPRSP
jgi:hypothetical protein